MAGIKSGSKPLLFPILVLAFVASASSQWVEKPGQGWLQIAVFHSESDEQFGTKGDVEKIPDEGVATATSLYLTGAIGIVPGADLWLQLPFHRMRFDDLVDNRESSGLGEPKVYARIGPELFGLPGWPVALRGGVKFARDLSVDTEIIPLGEGQRDWELIAELGYSLPLPVPTYVAGWFGYRWREQVNKDDAPGNERFFHAKIESKFEDVTLALETYGTFGDPPQLFGINVTTAQREWVDIMPLFGLDLGPGVLKLGGRFTVTGKNITSGSALVLSYFFKWKL